MIGSSLQATIKDGLLTTNVGFMSSLQPRLRIELVTSALEFRVFVPVRNVWVSFQKQEDAQSVVDKLNNTVLRDIRLEVTLKGSTSGRVWSAQLTNMTEIFDEAYIRSLLPANGSPPNAINFGPLTCDPLHSPSDALKRKITEVTNRNVTGHEIKSKGLHRTISFEFAGSPNLASLATRLNGTKVEDLGNSKISAGERMCVVFSVTRSAYSARSKMLKHLAGDVWLDRKVAVHIDDEDGQPAGTNQPSERVIITLKGLSRSDISLAKSAIDGVFARAVDKHLQQAQKPQGVQTHRIRLTKTKDYRDAVKPDGGLERAQRMLGADVVDLDEDSEPPAIIVRGHGAVLRKVKEALRMSPSDAEAALTCTICYDNLDGTVIMPGCGHCCCKDCFALYCSTDVGSKFPLRCFDSDCSEAVPVQLVRRELNDEKLKELMHAAVTDHLQQHPQAYAQCSGPDCSAWYHIEAAGEQNVCSSCFTTSCVNCKIEQHFGDSCAEHRERSEGHPEALQRWADLNNAKRCPRCQTLVEKIDGCHHMECVACRAHFCWVCLKLCETNQEIYAHMMAEHGGYFDIPGEGINPEQENIDVNEQPQVEGGW